jgi:short-subunit dehydrogenase
MHWMHSACMQVELWELDLASMESIRRFAKEINEKRVKPNVLINNAGTREVEIHHLQSMSCQSDVIDVFTCMQR